MYIRPCRLNNVDTAVRCMSHDGEVNMVNGHLLLTVLYCFNMHVIASHVPVTFNRTDPFSGN